MEKMEKIEIHIIEEKSLLSSEKKIEFFGDGEWVNEPDLLKFQYRGYNASVIRIFFKETFTDEKICFGGHLCGYVEIPKNHPLFLIENIEVNCHGGITYDCTDENRDIGFDCAHSCDLIPSLDF